MKGYLFDENLPTRLKFVPALPVIHSTDVGLSLTDSSIWSYAKERSLVIVTQDSDFSERIVMSSPPPWIVHVRFGNMRRAEFHPLLSRLWPKVEALLPAHKLITLFIDHIETVRD